MSRRAARALADVQLAPRFILSREMMADPAIEVRTLDEGGIFHRPPAFEVADLSGGGIVHPLSWPMQQDFSAKALVGLPSGAEIRGSMLLKLRGGRLHLPRQGGDADTHGFLDYLRTLPEDPPEARYHSRLVWANGQHGPDVAPAATVTVPGDVFWATADEPYNYGVWLLQVLPAVARAETDGFDGALLCHAPHAWQQDILRSVAPRLSTRLVQHDLNRTFRATGRIWTVAQDRRNFVVTPSESAIFDALVERVLAAHDDPTPEHIYVSRLARSREAPGYRTLLNEEALAGAMAESGLAVVEPERLPFLKQIALFARARTVVGPGGAGLFNAVFCRAGARVLTVESSNVWVEAHVNIFSSRNLPYAVVFGRQEAEDEGPQKRWTVPVAETMALLARFRAG